MLTLALGLLLPVASDLHVDAAANCAAANGSQSSPFCSISEALGVAANGDVIRIAPGTYAERLVIDVDVKLVGVGGAAVTTLDGELSRSLVETTGGTDVEFDGLTLTRGRGDSATITSGGDLTLRNTTVSGCCPSGLGVAYGAVYGGAGAGALTVEDCVFALNGLGCPGQRPGGIVWSGATGPVSVLRTTFDRNHFGVRVDGCDLVVRDSSFVDVTSRYTSFDGFEYIGFTLMARNGNAEVTNSTLTGGLSGGFWGWSAQPAETRIQNCTITDCVSDLDGGGAVRGAASMRVTISNSIIANNFNRMLPYPELYPSDISGVVFSGGHNLIGVNGFGNAIFFDGLNGDQVGTLAVPLEPHLAPLADNGGPTLTRAPLSISTAVGLGEPVDLRPFDQRGIVRPDGLNDIGAFQTTVGSVSVSCLSEPNSTGGVGIASASGSALIVDNAVTLGMSGLPAAAQAFFIISRTAGFAPGAGGSDGNLCLGGQLGRYVGPGQTMHSGAYGEIVLEVDLQAIPQPNGFVPVAAGETWFLQGWHRDIGANGSPTSNFTNAVMVTWW